MFYAFTHTITAADIESNPHEETLKLTAGVIHQVDILFQDGCDHKAKVQVYQAGHQIWPTNPGGALVANASVISFREFLELESGAAELTAKIWGDGVITGVDVIIEIGVLPGKIIRPFQLEDLLNLAMGE
jgi:hypothetical protein